jgi:hypothetical protein
MSKGESIKGKVVLCHTTIGKKFFKGEYYFISDYDSEDETIWIQEKDDWSVGQWFMLEGSMREQFHWKRFNDYFYTMKEERKIKIERISQC